MMNQIREFFVPFIGQLFWQVRRGHGSFLTMEFGMPHLAVRGPIATGSVYSWNGGIVTFRNDGALVFEKG